MNVLIYNLTCGVLPEVKSAFDGHRVFRVNDFENPEAYEDVTQYLRTEPIDVVVLAENKTTELAAPQSLKIVQDFHGKNVSVPIILLHNFTNEEIAPLMGVGPLVLPISMNVDEAARSARYTALITQAKALLNHGAGQAKAEFKLYGLTITGSDVPDIILLNKKLDVTISQRQILEALVRARGSLLSREMLIDRVSGDFGREMNPRAIDSLIKFIRRTIREHLMELQQPFPNIDIIATEYGSGYRIDSKNLRDLTNVFHGETKIALAVPAMRKRHGILDLDPFFQQETAQAALSGLKIKGITTAERLTEAFVDWQSSNGRTERPLLSKVAAAQYLYRILRNKRLETVPLHVFETLADISGLEPKAAAEFVDRFARPNSTYRPIGGRQNGLAVGSAHL